MKLNKVIAIFGCKNTTKILIDNLLEITKINYLITIDNEKGIEQKVAGYEDLNEYAESNEITVYTANKYSLKTNEDLLNIQSFEIDIAFVIGWQRIIPSEILDTFSIGAFGMHGSSQNLPKGRGRSPMNWSIIEGRKAFYTNLFKYDPGVDSGDILDTFKFQISEKDTAETMHYKNTLSMVYLVKKNFTKLINNDFILKKQNNLTPTYYPKRTEVDSQINWEENVYDIERLVRAVSPPFGGAFTYYKEEKIRIFKAQIFDYNEFGFEDELPGTVVEIFDNNLLVKCFGGLLLITKYKSDIKIHKNMNFFNKDLTYHKINKLGYYDHE